MKRYIVLILFLLSLIVIIFYLKADYSIDYKINKIKVMEKFENNRYYFFIDNKYQLDVYSKRKFNKKLITNIKRVKDNNEECLILTSKKLEVYPLCYKDNKQISYDLIESKKLKKYFNAKENIKEDKDKSFEFFNNLDSNTYIAVWKYNGFYIMNEDEINTLNILKDDRYSNDLSVIAEKYIFLPDYDSEHVFNAYYKVDITKNKYKKIEIPFDIDYDSYILGTNEEFIYIYDKKYKTEYEINIKKDKVKVIGNEEDGYIKYTNGKESKTSWSKLDSGKIKFTFNKDSNYTYKVNNNLTMKMKENNKLETIIYDKKVDYIDEYQNHVYFLDGEYLYDFIPYYGSKKIARNFEWNFNKDNTIFIFNK